MSIKDYIWLHINECANLFDSWFYFLLLPDGQEVLVNGSQETAASQVGIFSKGNFRNNEQCAVIMLFYYYFHYSDVQNRVTCSESPLNPAALRERYFVLLLSFMQFCNKDNYSLLWHLFPWQCEFSFKRKKKNSRFWSSTTVSAAKLCLRNHYQTPLIWSICQADIL